MSREEKNPAPTQSPERSSGQGGDSPVDPRDEAQRQDAPEKLHGDPIRSPGSVKDR